MAALIDLHPDGTHPVLSGVAEVHGLLDRMHAGAGLRPWLQVGTRIWSPSSIGQLGASRR